MENFIEWLTALPPWALYGSMAVVAAVENIFPPIPADTVVALGAVLAANGERSAIVAFTVVWVGNITGAMIMYGFGRRFGAGWMEGWMQKAHGSQKQENRLENLYLRFGLGALALSRLLPGVRALVPPFAGAMRLPALSVLLVMALPSGLWYGVVTYVGFRVGANLDAAMAVVASAQGWLAGVAAVALLVGGVAWVVHRRRSRTIEGPPSANQPTE